MNCLLLGVVLHLLLLKTADTKKEVDIADNQPCLDHEGKELSHGERSCYNEDPCDQCRCWNGKLDCIISLCRPSINCRQFIYTDACCVFQCLNKDFQHKAPETITHHLKNVTGVTSINGVNESRNKAITWLMSQQSSSFYWGSNTHRAIVALYLSGAAEFIGVDLQEKLMVKQLELHAMVALQGNSTDRFWMREMSMYVNALAVTCRNPRRFYGHNLVEILAEKVKSATSPRSVACLALCIANRTLAESTIRSLLKLLSDNSNHSFIRYIEVMTVMALTCIKKKTNSLEKIKNATNIFDGTIKKFIAVQHPDGSFGDIYTTALITQVLLSNGQEDNKLWNQAATLNFLMYQLNTSRNFLATYMVLPILNGKSLVDLKTVHCIKSRKNPKHSTANIIKKRRRKVRIQYSLYIGNLKDVIHTTYLRVPENSTYYDVMKIAQKADPKYKFLHRQVDDHVHIYELAGITNTKKIAGIAPKLWLLFTESKENGSFYHNSKSPDELVVSKGIHLIMWYTTVWRL